MFTTRRRLSPLFVVLVLSGPFVGAWTYYLVRVDQRERARARFEEFLAQRAVLTQARIAACTETLHHVAALYGSSEYVSRSEFSAFARPALARHPEILSIAWAPRVTADQREAHLALMHEQGLPNYGITHHGSASSVVPATAREVAYPIAYREPEFGGLPGLGLDVAFEAEPRAALERALASGEPEICDPRRFTQTPGSSGEVAMFLPIFEREVEPRAGHDPAVLGVLVLVWRVSDLLTQVFGPDFDDALQDLRIDVQDPRGSWGPSPVYPATSETGASSPRASAATAEIQVADRTLRMESSPGPAFISGNREDRPVILGALAFILGGLAALAVGARAWRDKLRTEHRALDLTRSLLRTLDQGVVVADRLGEIQLVNEAAEAMVGSLGDTIARRGWAPTGAGVLVGVPGSPEARGTLPLARALAGERFQDEEFFVRSASAPEGIWLHVSGGPLRSVGAEMPGAVVVFRDVTQARVRDEALKRLTAAVDQAADSIFMSDREGHIEYVNRGFEETTGYTRAEAVGKTPRLLKSGVHDDEHYRTMWETILRGEVYRGTTINRRKSGKLYTGEQSITPIRDSQGRITHFVSVTKDMTERRLLREYEAEVRLAGAIQQRLYPQTPPRIAGLDVAGAVYPAGVACGDYLDYIPLEDGTWVLVIGDVSGHGIGPALIMVETRAHLRSLMDAGTPLEDAVTRLNELLCDDIPNDRFVSLLLVRYDPARRYLRYVNAGHPPGVVVRVDGTVRADLTPTGPALALIPGAVFVAREVQLEDGDVVTLLTDGLTEVHAPDGELYEPERVLEVVRDHRGASAAEVAAALFASSSAFAAGRVKEDDVTLLVFKVAARVALAPAVAAAVE